MNLDDETMTPLTLMAEMDRLKNMVGVKAWVHFSICGDFCVLNIRSDFTSQRDGKIATLNCDDKSFRDAIKEAEEKIKAWKIQNFETNLRNLAFAIIEITDEHKHCTTTLLRDKGFSVNQIAEYHVAACARASEMCANALFVVEGV